MGGDYYDRDVGTSGTSGTTGTSQASSVLRQTNIHTSCDPKRWVDDKLEVSALNPIVFALDVTGSMGEWTKIIYDKMPMFYGQIKMQKYLEDPCISFCAIGDHYSDSAPLQCTEFGRGNEIDQLISKIYLEGGGGGNGIEDYQMSAYFYDHRVNMKNHEIPFLFITGDEGFYESLDMDVFKNMFGISPNVEKSVLDRLKGFDKNSTHITGNDIFKLAKEKYNVFIVKKEYSGNTRDQWAKALGEERVLDIKTPKACVDIILGAIALTSGKRNLETYVDDLIERGQSTERVEEVKLALGRYDKAIKNRTAVLVVNKVLSIEEIGLKAAEIRMELYKDKAEKYDKCKELNGDQFPKEFCCSISKKVMIDPVVCSDGETFDRESIKLWLSYGNKENPFTGQTIDSDLTANQILKKMIDDFVEKY